MLKGSVASFLAHQKLQHALVAVGLPISTTDRAVVSGTRPFAGTLQLSSFKILDTLCEPMARWITSQSAEEVLAPQGEAKRCNTNIKWTRMTSKSHDLRDTVAQWLVRRSRDLRVSSSSPRRCVYILFLGKTLNSHSAFLHPSVKMGTSKMLGDNLGGNLRCTSIPSRGSRNTPSRFILH